MRVRQWKGWGDTLVNDSDTGSAGDRIQDLTLTSLELNHYETIPAIYEFPDLLSQLTITLPCSLAFKMLVVRH